MRRAAIHELCPCEVKRDFDVAWDRIFEFCDGSPRAREPEVLVAVERSARDPERTVRRIARKVLAHYRRTGRINVL